MIKPAQLSFILILLFFGCNNPEMQKSPESLKAEIIQVEQDFNAMAQEQGLALAFQYFAAPDGVIKRRNKIIQGKKAIYDWYESDAQPRDTLTWKPTFVDVSKSGDMAYTYGDFLFISYDSIGTRKEGTGIFHTVWKKQPDGNWKYVWD